MLYDGLCPLCATEVRLLRRHDRGARVAFEDISAPGFDPARYGLTFADVIGQMHAVLPGGDIVRGVDVFIHVYRAVGWTTLASILSFRPTRPIVDFGYRLFAWVRPYLSRFDRAAACSGDRCAKSSGQVVRHVVLPGDSASA